MDRFPADVLWCMLSGIGTLAQGIMTERFSTSLIGEAKTLLLATDGSHFSDGAIQEAIFFSQACGARLIVLHTVRIEAESAKAAHSKIIQQQQSIEPHLSLIRKMAMDSGIDFETKVLSTGNPEKTIVEQARLHNADVILMGRHGKTARLSLLVGSMTAKVIGLGFPKVLVVPKNFLITGAHVLLAMDGSPNSLLAMREALNMGRTCATLERLTIISVARRAEGLSLAEKLVNEACAQLQMDGLRADCEPIALTGNPVELITQTAREKNTDMILLGGQGKNNMAKLLMGHVTENVIGRAHCAVLVVTS